MRNRIRSIALLVFAAAACSTTLKDGREAAFGRGWWVECEGSRRTLDSAERIQALVDHADRAGVTDLFIQVYRGGRAWFASDLVPRTARAAGGMTATDPLRLVLDLARPKGIRVHAWLNIYKLERDAKAPVLRHLGRDAVLVDNLGRSLLDYPGLEFPGPDARLFELDTPAYWLDPSNEKVHGFHIRLIEELVTRYRDLDGIHFDFVRYPYALPVKVLGSHRVGRDFGYHPDAIRRFAEAGAGEPFDPLRGARTPSAFDRWRRDAVTRFVRDASGRARTLSPDIRVSAAVLAWADRAYLSAFQDWRSWVSEGLLDLAVPMCYSRDDRLFSHLVRSAVASRGASRHGAQIWIGIGAYLHGRDPDQTLRQIEEAAREAADGAVAFSYDSMLDRDALIGWRGHKVGLISLH